jgi:hypothetical protein
MAGCLGVLFPWIAHCPLPAADERAAKCHIKTKKLRRSLAEECARPRTRSSPTDR